MKNKSEKPVRTETFQIRMTPAEKQAAQQVAIEKGAKLSQVVRELLTNQTT